VSQQAPPEIFSPKRRHAVRARFRAGAKGPDAASFILDDMVEDVIDRLGFLRVQPRRALVLGDTRQALGSWLEAQGAEVVRGDPYGAFDEHTVDIEQPLPFAGFDFIACLGLLDTANDLPGALIHLRGALAPGGLAIAQFVGAGSLHALRAAMLEADGDRPAPRLHPAVDVRAGGQLLQRAGWADPVVDSRSLEVRYSALDRLVGDLRAHGLSNCLARPGPPLTRTALERARASFGTGAIERFEILTLSGWKRPSTGSG
jgi:SAM-dependent methyltransferase